MNRAIENQAQPREPGKPTLPYEVRCVGPEDELRLLGGVCGAPTLYLGWVRTDAPGGMGTSIGPLDGPFLMLFNRVERDPPPGENVAAELKYAAYFVQRGPGENSVDTLDQWKDGEAVRSGSLVTYRASFGACSESWVGEGSLLWRSTTLTFAWSALLPC